MVMVATVTATTAATAGGTNGNAGDSSCPAGAPCHGMEYRRLGRSGLQVSALSYGAWISFGLQLGVDQAYALMERAYHGGINCGLQIPSIVLLSADVTYSVTRACCIARERRMWAEGLVCA